MISKEYFEKQKFNKELSRCSINMEHMESEQAQNALKIADTLSNMILFHDKVRKNGTAMMETWD